LGQRNTLIHKTEILFFLVVSLFHKLFNQIGSVAATRIDHDQQRVK